MKELAIYLDLSPHTIKAWLYQGKIPFKRIGRCIKFDLQKINKMIDEINSAASVF